MELEIVEKDSDLTRVALRGKLDIEGLHQVDIGFHANTAARGVNTIVDIAGVDFVASLGLGMFISCAKSLQRKGAQMVLMAPQPVVAEVLKVAGIYDAMPVVDTLDAAQAALA